MLPTEDDLFRWLATGWHNYSVVVGWNHLVVLDFDSLEYFDLWALWMNSVRLGFVDSCFKVLTARGIHVYLQTIVREENSKRVGIDVQAQNKYVVGPGCVHPSGEIYQPVGEIRFVEVESIAVVLPVELFPLAAQKPAQCHEDLFRGALGNQQATTEYDAFQSAMFPDDGDLITKVKRAVRIESLFSSTYKTSADGRWLSTLCIFHDDHRPSMWIDTKLQICGCTVCNFKPMDCINLYAHAHNVSNSDAVKLLAKEIGI